ncbi:MAG: glycoside hydrolase domain-containing protein [Caulobacterales bacterium]
MVDVIDTPWNIVPHVAELQTGGVKAIIRYLNNANSSILPEKCVTLAETRAIAAAGLTMALVFEQAQNAVRYFTAAAGKTAAIRTISLCQSVVGPPAGRPVYFAVDYDAVVGDLPAIDSYFAAVKAQFDASAPGQFAIGVYGSGLVCAHLLDGGTVGYAWLAQSSGWSGTADFARSGRWSLKQGFKPATGGFKFDYDPNDTNPAAPDFGAFAPQPPPDT